MTIAFFDNLLVSFNLSKSLELILTLSSVFVSFVFFTIPLISFNFIVLALKLSK